MKAKGIICCLVLTFLVSGGICCYGGEIVVESPNKKVGLRFWLDNSRIYYSVVFNGREAIEPSRAACFLIS